jgi:zinc transport system permease protein
VSERREGFGTRDRGPESVRPRVSRPGNRPQADDEAHVDHLGHMHVHRPDCGHPRVPHEDHEDWVHGQHRHARHQAHYDEH